MDNERDRSDLPVLVLPVLDLAVSVLPVLSFCVLSMASSYPVRAEKGANWAARLDMDIRGCLLDIWCGRCMIDS